MPEPIPQTRLGIYAGFDRRIPIPVRIEQIREAGFGATCLWWPECDGEWRRLRDSVPDLVRNAGLALDNVHVPYTGCNALWSSDAAVRTEVVGRHIRALGDCESHGVPTMVMHVTLGTRAEFDLASGLDSVQRIVDAADDRGIVIAIENTRKAELIEFLLESVESPTLGLCFDTGHDRLYGATPLQLLERWSHRVVTTHLSDNDGKRDRHWLPGDGVVDFDRANTLLRGSGYEGGWMIEAVCGADDAATDFLARGYRALKRITYVEVVQERAAVVGQ